VVVCVIGFDQVREDYLVVLVLLLPEIEDGFQCEVPVLTPTVGDGSILVLCAVLCQEFVAPCAQDSTPEDF
jgi:hypothetical protein